MLPALRLLDLNDNLVGCRGCAAVISAATEQRALQLLSVKGNRVGDANCSSLTEALSEPDCPLRCLLLDGCPLGPRAAAAIADAALASSLREDGQAGLGGLLEVSGLPDGTATATLLRLRRGCAANVG